MQHISGSGQSAAAGSILPTQQQLHEIYEENLRLREEVVKTSTAGGGGPASAEAAAARNQVCHIFFHIVASALRWVQFVLIFGLRLPNNHRRQPVTEPEPISLLLNHLHILESMSNI